MFDNFDIKYNPSLKRTKLVYGQTKAIWEHKSKPAEVMFKINTYLWVKLAEWTWEFLCVMKQLSSNDPDFLSFLNILMVRYS